MPTYTQIKHNCRVKKKKKKIPTPALFGCPQRKGSCVKSFIKTPRKPSSGKRKVVKVNLRSGKVVDCHIPGIGHSIQKYSTVLVKGSRVRDIPAMKYRIIRGKFDAQAVYERRTSRSKYGLRKSTEL
jgi:small subunit ribosomal protein S12